MRSIVDFILLFAARVPTVGRVNQQVQHYKKSFSPLLENFAQESTQEKILEAIR